MWARQVFAPHFQDTLDGFDSMRHPSFTVTVRGSEGAWRVLKLWWALDGALWCAAGNKGSPAAAAPLNWREAEQRELSRPTTAIEAMSENKLKRVREAAPSLGLTGASFKIPAADDIAAATMSWASNLPAVVASMTPAEKAQVWDEFQQASMSKAAELAYSELEAGDEILEPSGGYFGAVDDAAVGGE